MLYQINEINVNFKLLFFCEYVYWSDPEINQCKIVGKYIAM